MKILISNDDGYQATGIVALYEALKDIADVEVVAPEQNNSAKSNALTLHSPMYVQTAANGFRYINGTPADCVHIALTGLLGYRPDLVVSGINNGANMGDDTIYSGTVGAASTCSTTERATCAAASSWPQPFSTCEKAIAGMPNKKPSIAAATVPEYKVSSPMLAPLLMPDSTRSGR